MFLIHTSPENAEIVARAVTSACRLDGWQSPVQPKLLHTLFNRLLAQDLDFEKMAPTSPAEVVAALRSEAERNELIQLMVATEILCNPIPERLERSIVQWATALHVHERSLLYVRDLMRGELTKQEQEALGIKNAMEPPSSDSQPKASPSPSPAPNPSSSASSSPQLRIDREETYWFWVANNSGKPALAQLVTRDFLVAQAQAYRASIKSSERQISPPPSPAPVAARPPERPDNPGVERSGPDSRPIDHPDYGSIGPVAPPR